MANIYITKHSLGLDELTGLEIELRVREIFINAQEQKVTIKVDKVLVSPTGIEMKNIESLYYERFNSENNRKYDQLDESPLGQGIKQMLNADLLNYPNLLQL